MDSQAPSGNGRGGSGAWIPEGATAVVPAGERRDQRATYSGFSKAFSHAFELVAVTVLFVLFGLWIDGRFGTRPVFTVLLGLLAVVGLAARAYYTYLEQVAEEEKGKPWLRKNQ
jgi:F0F1-type ATP synthase assembly protein I